MLHDVLKVMRLPIDTFDEVRGESESLAGLVLELAGEFPAINTTIKAGDFEFIPLQTENNRILSVKVTVNTKD